MWSHTSCLMVGVNLGHRSHPFTFNISVSQCSVPLLSGSTYCFKTHLVQPNYFTGEDYRGLGGGVKATQRLNNNTLSKEQF